ncbi:MAG TPA: acyl-CoA dehydrogenase family protein [Acidimicrobiales bacterium]
MSTDSSNDAFVYEDPEESRALRSRLRGLIADNLPPGWLGPFTNDPADLDISNRFCELLASEGLLVTDWPKEYGGQDFDLASSVVVREEMWAHFEPRGGQYYGPNWLGPSIFHYGTQEQKDLHLPEIARGHGLWCQGFSEPDAGSDLANMATKAVPDGDGFRISGQKTWTSWALWAEWCYLLARVEGFGDGTSKKEGITVFLIPMDREGITVRGLDGIPGPHHLNEVFLDEVWADRSEVLGELGAGWQVIRDALSNERVGIARYARDDRLLAMALADEEFRTALPARRWVEARVRNRMSRLMCRRALWFQRDGGSHDFIVSAARMITTRSNLLVSDTIAEAVGDHFFEGRHTPDPALLGAAEFFWRYMQAGTVASGTTEMLQRGLSRALFSGERIRVTEDVEEIRSSIDRLAAAHNGADAARHAIDDPSLRTALVAPLEGIIEGLDPRDGYFEALAAAEVCRGAGHAVLPLPVEAMLLRRASGRPLVQLSSHGRFEHGDLFEAWDAADADGSVHVVEAVGDRVGSKVGPFVNLEAPRTVGDSDPLSTTERALLQILPSWYLLGAAEKALDLAAVYATERVQFGSPISKYQGVAFPLADAAAELQALYELALLAVHSLHGSPETALVDALALRWAALDVVRKVLRIAHQVLGAVGMCDEHDLTIITLTLQARLRLPTDLEASTAALAVAIDEHGFDSIFTPVGGAATA